MSTAQTMDPCLLRKCTVTYIEPRAGAAGEPKYTPERAEDADGASTRVSARLIKLPLYSYSILLHAAASLFIQVFCCRPHVHVTLDIAYSTQGKTYKYIRWNPPPPQNHVDFFLHSGLEEQYRSKHGGSTTHAS